MSSVGDTIRGLVALVSVLLGTVLVALGLDFGFTLQTIIAVADSQDSMQLRLVLLGLGTVCFLFAMLVVPPVDEPEDVDNPHVVE